MRTGMRIKWLGEGSRKVDLPVPLLSKSALVGSVNCNPIGDFPIKDGEELLRRNGPNGLFKLVEYVDNKFEKKPDGVSARDHARGKTFKMAAHAAVFIKKNKLIAKPKKNCNGRWFISFL